MDVSRFKVEIYDFLALLIPGLMLLAIIFYSSAGWHPSLLAVTSLTGSSITALFLLGFALGHFVQECSDFVIKKVVGPRFFLQWRDKLWSGADAERLKSTIEADGGSCSTVDAAFNFCLTRVASLFPKRDLFVATSDFSRAMVLVGLIGVFAVVRLVHDHSQTWKVAVGWSIAGVALLTVWVFMFWKRTCRFREYSETPVFYAYLAQRSQQQKSSAAGDE